MNKLKQQQQHAKTVGMDGAIHCFTMISVRQFRLETFGFISTLVNESSNDNLSDECSIVGIEITISPAQHTHLSAVVSVISDT